MTIALALKVGDGVVLGADSASSLMAGAGVVNVYNNAEKVFNLRKQMPIGAVTYGLGGLGGRSTTRLAKDLRARLTEGGEDWALTSAYTIEQVAEAVRRYFYDELYRAEYPLAGQPPAPPAPPGEDTPSPPPPSSEAGTDATPPAAPPGQTGAAVDPTFPPMGFLVAGFSANAKQAEVWQVEVDTTGCCDVHRVFGPDEYGAEAKGQPDPIYRLLRGWSADVLNGLVRSGIDSKEALSFLQGLPVAQLLHPAMPIQDAIDLVEYLVDVTAGFVRFAPGAPTVAPPIDVAAITVHEGFQWVKRKHYYSAELNPEPSNRTGVPG